MIEMTPGAEGRLNDYLNELRRVLTGSPSVNAVEVEQDVRDHIHAALAGRSGPVEASALDDVLRTLGAPAQWLPDGERSWLNRSPSEWVAEARSALVETGRKIVGGPESYRLAYLALFVLALAWIIASAVGDEEGVLAGLVGTLCSFLLARAALALIAPESPTAAQKWLIYPSLWLVYAPLAALVMAAIPVLGGTLAFDELVLYPQARARHAENELRELDKAIVAIQDRGQGDASPELDRLRLRKTRVLADLEQLSQPQRIRGVPVSSAFAFSSIAALTGAWWLVVGLIAGFCPVVVRAVFHPFAVRFSRRWAFGLAAVGGVLFASFALFVA